jgi:hypothetical protein
MGVPHASCGGGRIMKVKTITRSESNLAERDYRDKMTIEVDGEDVFEVNDGEPKDNNLSRNFSDCFKISKLMKMAYAAGKNGEEIEFTTEKEDE